MVRSPWAARNSLKVEGVVIQPSLRCLAPGRPSEGSRSKRSLTRNPDWAAALVRFHADCRVPRAFWPRVPKTASPLRHKRRLAASEAHFGMPSLDGRFFYSAGPTTALNPTSGPLCLSLPLAVQPRLRTHLGSRFPWLTRSRPFLRYARLYYPGSARKTQRGGM
jgi:hypothetical protein